ncbi:MAG: hypothetical protein AAGK00_07340 [Pseudomonadota bacterium]
MTDSSIPILPKWIDLPSPPAPTKINEFPAQPEQSVVGSQMIAKCLPPDAGKRSADTASEISAKPWFYFVVHSRLDVHGVYSAVVQGTATVDAPFSQAVSVTTGSSETTSFSEGWKVTVEADAEVAKISEELSATFDHSQTISRSETITDTFEITPTSQTPEVTAVWWQAAYTYTLTPIHIYLKWNFTKPINRHFDAYKIECRSDGWYFQGKKYCELSYTMENKVKTYVVSQFPPPASGLDGLTRVGSAV